MFSIVRDHYHYISSFCEFESWFFCALCIDSLSLWKVEKYLGEKIKVWNILKCHLWFSFYEEFWIVPCYRRNWIQMLAIIISKLQSHKRLNSDVMLSPGQGFISTLIYIYILWIKIMVEHITEENSYSRTPKLMFYKVITFAVKKPYIHIIENKTLRCFFSYK